MGNAFFVVWRESLEALLIAGILYAWLDAAGGGSRGRFALFSGLAAGVVLALMLGWALLGIQSELSGNALELFQTGALFVAAALVTQMVLWMRRHGRQMKSRLHAELTTAAGRSGNFGVAVVAMLAVAREGAETVIFLYGLAQGGEFEALAAGALAGLAAAVGTAWIAARCLAKLNVALLLRLSSMLLLVLASAMLVAACDRLIGAGWLPSLLDPVWDSTWLLDDASTVGKLLADFSGYRARPPLSSLIAWAGYWLAVTTLWHKAGRVVPKNS